MPKAIRKNILSHEIIETGNEKTLVFIDSSEYMSGKEPEGPMLEVLLPGYDRYLLVNYDARRVNTFNSSTIGLNPVLTLEELVPLPDGIYTIKQKVCPYEYVYIVKRSMRVTHLLNKVKVLYRNIDFASLTYDRNKEMQDALLKIHVLIEGAKAAVEPHPNKAQEYYQLADRLVEKQLNKFCKNCK